MDMPETTPVVAVPVPDIGTRVAQYVALRALIKTIEDRHKEELKLAKETLAQLNGALLGHLKAIGADNVKTPSGTVYQKTRKSASIADGDLFWQFVEGGQLWDLIDRKANVTAVEAYLEEHKALPPGINYSVMLDVGVRKS